MARAKLPDFLKRTDEQKAEDAERQAVLAREYGPRTRLTPEERLIQHAAGREKVARAELDSMTKEDMKDRERVGRLKEMLGDAVADQGRLEEAFEVTSSDERAAHYKRTLEAVMKDDDTDCNCKPEDGQDKHIVVDEIFSIKHNRIVPLVACCSGKHLNAGKVPEEIQKVQAVARESKTPLKDAEIKRKLNGD